ncbi:hypothetical protein MMEU_4548 [Mycobacterium marinum str. Europe]|nr:hypothetical protein MMEU_4548 [Mycobacterium marinum str. Europe]
MHLARPMLACDYLNLDDHIGRLTKLYAARKRVARVKVA